MLFVLCVYWPIGRWGFRIQNLIVILGSCIFYGWFDYRFLLLLMLGVICDYGIGLSLMSATRPWSRRLLLGLSLAVDLGALITFKYMNFLVQSFASMLNLFGLQASVGTLNLIVPLGISFFTLQRLSYTIDIYRGRLAATRDFLAFAAFSSFFPLLLSGPIERAARLLPQFQRKRTFDLDSH